MFYQGHTNHNIWYVIENLSSHTLIEFCTVVRFTCGLSENILSSFDSHTGRVKNYGRSHSEQGNGKCSAYSAVHWYQTCNSKNNPDICNDDEGDPWIIEDEHKDDSDDDNDVKALMTRTHRLRSGRNNLTVTHSATRSLLWQRTAWLKKTCHWLLTHSPVVVFSFWDHLMF